MLVTSLALDPIEKKPLARFLPGSRILSVGSLGCTMHCPWCQNYQIAQPADPSSVPAREMSARELAEMAASYEDEGNIGLAYTYNEPLLHWRAVLDCAREIRSHGMRNVLVTNGLISSGNLAQLAPFIDAANVDLKGYTQDVYDICGGTLEMVKSTIAQLHDAGAHVEVTTLVIPGLNDDSELMGDEAQWIASISPDMPLHLTRFFPCYKYFDRRPTPLETLYELQEVARRHLSDVLLGNV